MPPLPSWQSVPSLRLGTSMPAQSEMRWGASCAGAQMRRLLLIWNRPGAMRMPTPSALRRTSQITIGGGWRRATGAPTARCALLAARWCRQRPSAVGGWSKAASVSRRQGTAMTTNKRRRSFSGKCSSQRRLMAPQSPSCEKRGDGRKPCSMLGYAVFALPCPPPLPPLAPPCPPLCPLCPPFAIPFLILATPPSRSWRRHTLHPSRSHRHRRRSRLTWKTRQGRQQR